MSNMGNYFINVQVGGGGGGGERILYIQYNTYIFRNIRGNPSRSKLMRHTLTIEKSMRKN